LAPFDEILGHIEMTEITCQSQRLEPIHGVGVDELRVTRQEPQDVVDLAGRRGFEDRQGDCFIARNKRFLMIRNAL
jgi:hypothetical protein